MLLDRLFFGHKKNDWILLFSILLLAGFGLAAIYSVALGRGAGEFLNFQKQIVWLMIGFLIMFFCAAIDYRSWRRWSLIGLVFGLILLVLVLTPLGSTIRGTRGWFNLGLFSFQPIELVKIFLILVLADIYSRYARIIFRFHHLFFTGLIVFVPLILALLQPDFGSGMVLFGVWLFSFFLLTRNKWHIVATILTLLGIFLISWLFIFQDYQKDRVRTFLNPSLDPLGRGYNVSQSLIAVGAGRLFGRGLGFGSQSQLKFIPESQTDFIFAVIAEEMGLVGVCLVIGLFAAVFARLYLIAIRAPDDFGMMTVILILILICLQVFVNVGMNIGLLPVTGISLPFVSYGGSFLMTLMVLIGIALNICRAGKLLKRDSRF